jgi:quinol monooxygenase YgiN
LEALRVLFDHLAQEQSFVDAWIHTAEDDPHLIVVYERWKETKESFIRDILPKPFFKPYLAVFAKLGVDRKVNWLQTRYAWRS